MSEVHPFSRKIVKHGVQLAIGLMIIAFVLYYLNRNVYNYDFYVNFLTFSVVNTSAIIFAEAIIGGLVIDYFIKKKDKDASK